jgi:hypothetical protein
LPRFPLYSPDFPDIAHLGIPEIWAIARKDEFAQKLIFRCIVGGIYKRHGFGTYVHPYGTKMATVLVQGKERNLWLTSIVKIEDEINTITISRSKYTSLLEDITKLTKEMKRLELKVKDLDKK